MARKKLAAAFDGGWLSSDSGVMLLSLGKRRCDLAKALTVPIADTLDVAHGYQEMREWNEKHF